MMTNSLLRLTVSIVLSPALLAADKTEPLSLKLGLWQMTYIGAERRYLVSGGVAR